MSNRSEKAELVLALLEDSGVEFSRNGLVFDAQKSMQSVDLVTSLLKLGLFSVNATSFPDEMTGKDGVKVDHEKIPSLIIGLGVDYAVEVSPRDPENENIILIDDLDAHVDRIERHVASLEGSPGGIIVDQDLIFSIRDLSVEREAAAPAASSAPVAGGDI